jgi:REP element-mobilizing transposase RayT
MATPRKLLVDPLVPLFYHVVSRCVRRSWLCGKDKVSGKDYRHRKQWLIDRIHFLAQYFAIEVHAYAIMSNHFHLVLFYDPQAHLRWSDEQTADRWLAVCPPRTWTGEIDVDAIPEAKALLLADANRLRHVRTQLGSMSTFMKHLKQPIARRANAEDGCKGHFFEQRFYSGALLSERAIIAALAYVDINPIRAEIVRTIQQCEDTSIAERLSVLESSPEALDAALSPLVSGLESSGRIVNITLRAYMDVAKTIANRESTPQKTSEVLRWQQDIAALARRQRAYGPPQLIESWLSARGMRLLEKPMSE